ncbi:MAG: sigma-54 dependent transcriptional regulator [Xanthomonadales bacterium]|nr:sigma-54 dependent transcriptional regulator [Xanthomonadales bacterium]
MPTALIIDDMPESLLALSETARNCGFSVDTARDLESARKHLLRELPEVAILNIQIGDADSEEEAFRLFARTDLADVLEVYLVTDKPTFESARRGMQAGASDWFRRPVDTERLKKSLARLQQDLCNSPTGAESIRASAGGLLQGSSPAMERVYRMIRKVAPTEATIFLAGESGTGKERISQAIHQLSRRAKGPFVAMNCGAISKDLIESEMFGHRKGAFTGADSAHKGFFERADGGTLLLDEVTEMNPNLQVKLLRVLETRMILPVGGEKELKTNVRIIASTNRDPEAAVAKGILREDLYYRLAEFPMRVPPLRERGDDVILLADEFLAEINQSAAEPKAFHKETLELLRLHDWSGNVRELRNAVFRAFILAEEEILPGDLPGNIPAGSGMSGDYLRFPVGYKLDEVEKRMILATLEHFDGDKPRTAEALGVSLKTLYNRLKKYGQK